MVRTKNLAAKTVILTASLGAVFGGWISFRHAEPAVQGEDDVLPLALSTAATAIASANGSTSISNSSTAQSKNPGVAEPRADTRTRVS